MQKNVVLYCVESILVPGFEAILAGLENFRLAAVYSTIPELMAGVARHGADMILLELSPDIHLGRLSEVKCAAGSAPIVLWVETVPIEFVSQAITLGVRGILPKRLPMPRQAECLKTVMDGGIWVEEALVSSLLDARSVTLTGRERQLTTLLAQGLRNKEIAFLLGITEGTVKVYLSRLYRKLGVSDRFELALYALKHLYADPANSSDLRSPQPAFASLPSPKFVTKAAMLHAN